jgi:hypothetical protein
VAPRERKELTVLVLGRPGAAGQRYRFGRLAIMLLAMALPCSGLAVGYVLGHQHALATRTSRRSMSHADAKAKPRRPAQPTVATPPALPAAEAARAMDASTPLAAAPAQAAAATTTANTAAAAAGESLSILPDGKDEHVIELHPFAADGSPNAGAFTALAIDTGCASGHSQQPDVALVHVLLDVAKSFASPLMLLGGRCSAHEDHEDTVAYHRAGRAIDFRVRGVPSEQLSAWLVKHEVPGVGRYRRAGYVHIDLRTGAHEQWEGEPNGAAKPAAPPTSVAAPAAAPGSTPEPIAPAAEPAQPSPAEAPAD